MHLMHLNQINTLIPLMYIDDLLKMQNEFTQKLFDS